MEQLQARILIKHVEGGKIIVCLYDREAFSLLNVEFKEDFQFIEIGDIIIYDDVKYIVKRINFRMSKELHDMGHGYGINLYSPTEPSDFNCQIGIFVDNA